MALEELGINDPAAVTGLHVPDTEVGASSSTQLAQPIEGEAAGIVPVGADGYALRSFYEVLPHTN